MTENEIIERVHVLHPGALIDIDGDNACFDVQVVSDRFAGKSSQERQRPILALFSGDLFSGRLGRLSIRAVTPDELNDASPATYDKPAEEQRKAG